jgi:hypothetical protein
MEIVEKMANSFILTKAHPFTLMLFFFFCGAGDRIQGFT